MKNRAYWIFRIEQHLADLANARSDDERERIMRRIGFASRMAEHAQ